MSITKDEILSRVKNILAKILNTDEDKITLEKKLVADLGAESLDLVTLLVELEDAFDKKITNEEAEKLVTVSDVVTFIQSKLNSGEVN
jgi:acyl carrier protein